MSRYLWNNISGIEIIIYNFSNNPYLRNNTNFSYFLNDFKQEQKICSDLNKYANPYFTFQKPLNNSVERFFENFNDQMNNSPNKNSENSFFNFKDNVEYQSIESIE